jgi:hypothetical protein
MQARERIGQVLISLVATWALTGCSYAITAGAGPGRLFGVRSHAFGSVPILCKVDSNQAHMTCWEIEVDFQDHPEPEPVPVKHVRPRDDDDEPKARAGKASAAETKTAPEPKQPSGKDCERDEDCGSAEICWHAHCK